jgi:beta-glucanase (GH16 family)
MHARLWVGGLLSRSTVLLGNTIFLLLITRAIVPAQTRNLVWSDEFNGPSIDTTTWSFGSGPSNDNIHYYTSRTANAQVSGGELQIIARKESYLGFAYTSALMQTRDAMFWRRGRIEARLKVPSGAGFVPAFWMMPEDSRYGWWPNSGEIDIMEYPTTQGGTVYGSAHAGAYSSFTGSAPKTGPIAVTDAETAFHVYAIEWSADTIAYYVDQTKYFAVTNDHSGSRAWPFDQPFYIIFDLAVGGGWVGNPTPATVFPAMMEVDYVRVYQILDDIGITGPDFVGTSASGVRYSVPLVAGATYAWSVPAGTQITAGQGTHQCTVTWGTTGGTVNVSVQTAGGTVTPTFPVAVSNSLLRNGSLEKGVKFWNTNAAPPGAATFSLDSTAGVAGSHWLKSAVTTKGNNPWDIQATQTGFMLTQGHQYEVRLNSRADSAGRTINASVINAGTYAVLGGTTCNLTATWNQYTFRFTPSSSVPGTFTVDFGAKVGVYYLDFLTLTDISGQTSVADPVEQQLPAGYSLFQNYPNPFNPSTVFSCQLPVVSKVTLSIYDALGREVATLIDEVKEPGTYSIRWDATGLPSGTYFYRMTAGGFTQTRKMTMIK